MARSASEEILSPPPGKNKIQQSILVRIAQHNFSILIDYMISSYYTSNLQEVDDLNFKVIGEITFAEARSYICPMWPICK